MNDDFAPLTCERELAGPTQFSLAALLEYITVCAVLLAFSTIASIASVVFLMAMAAALAARQGWIALASLGAALLFADCKFGPNGPNSSYGQQLFAILLAALLCTWYKYRAKGANRAGVLSLRVHPCEPLPRFTRLHGPEHRAL